LSEAHRDQPGTGCPVVALAGDITRGDKRTRALVTQQIRDNIELLASLIHDANEKNKRGARSQAILTYCALVGAAAANPSAKATLPICQTLARNASGAAGGCACRGGGAVHGASGAARRDVAGHG
jgi:hypothetical protein